MHMRKREIRLYVGNMMEIHSMIINEHKKVGQPIRFNHIKSSHLPSTTALREAKREIEMLNYVRPCDRVEKKNRNHFSINFHKATNTANGLHDKRHENAAVFTSLALYLRCIYMKDI